MLADITCDSDGKIDHFIDRRDVKDVLELHHFHAGEPYYLGVFLVGAYQEILGDLHNLFGDTNAVHVSLDEDEGYTDRGRGQRRHGERRAPLRALQPGRPGRPGAAGGRDRRCAPSGSRWRSPGCCCAATRKGCRATLTWSRTDGDRRTRSMNQRDRRSWIP